MQPIHWRMAELTAKQSHHTLTEEELTEMALCLRANMNHAFKLSKLYNLSLAASETNDMEWQHEICEQIDRLEIDAKIPPR